MPLGFGGGGLLYNDSLAPRSSNDFFSRRRPILLAINSSTNFFFLNFFFVEGKERFQKEYYQQPDTDKMTNDDSNEVVVVCCVDVGTELEETHFSDYEQFMSKAMACDSVKVLATSTNSNHLKLVIFLAEGNIEKMALARLTIPEFTIKWLDDAVDQGYLCGVDDHTHSLIETYL